MNIIYVLQTKNAPHKIKPYFQPPVSHALSIISICFWFDKQIYSKRGNNVQRELIRIMEDFVIRNVAYTYFNK